MNEVCSLEEIDLEIIVCTVKRLSTKEALEDLKSKGFDIKERTYFDHKKKLKEIKIQRLGEGLEGQIEQYFRLLDSLELVQQNLWHELKTVSDPNLKLKILNSIKDNQILIYKFHEALPQVMDNQIHSFTKYGNIKRVDYRNFRIDEIKYELKPPDTLEPPSFFPKPLSEEVRNTLEKELKELESKDQHNP